MKVLHAVDNAIDVLRDWFSSLHLTFQICIFAAICCCITCTSICCRHCCCANTCRSYNEEGARRRPLQKQVIIIKDDKRKLSREGKKKRLFQQDIDDIKSVSSSDESSIGSSVGSSVGSSTMDEGGSILSTFWENIKASFPKQIKNRKRIRVNSKYTKLGSDYDRLSSRDNVVEYVEELDDDEYSTTDTEEGKEEDEATESNVISVISSSHMAYKYVQ